MGPALSSRSGTVVARDLGVRNGRAWVFRHVDVEVAPSTLVAVHAARGRDRVPLLLTLAGRIRASEGSAQVAGLDVRRHRRAVRRLVGLGEMANVNDLDRPLRIVDLVRERLALAHGPARHLGLEQVLEPVGLDVDPATVVDDLGACARLLFGTALALVGGPAVVALEAVDVGLTGAECQRVWATLRRVAGSGVTVLAGCVEPGPPLLIDAEVGL